MRNSVVLGATNGNSLIKLVPCLDQRRSSTDGANGQHEEQNERNEISDCTRRSSSLILGKGWSNYGEFEIGETSGICNFEICKPIRR
jgi:hypothetical protein